MGYKTLKHCISVMISYERKYQEYVNSVSCTSAFAKCLRTIKSAEILLGGPWQDISGKPINKAYNLIPDEADGLAFITEEDRDFMSKDSTHLRLEMELGTISKYAQSRHVGSNGWLIICRHLDDIATRCSEIQLCPALVEPILSRLPRELRDHMYVIAFLRPECIAVECFLWKSAVPTYMRTVNIADHTILVATICFGVIMISNASIRPYHLFPLIFNTGTSPPRICRIFQCQYLLIQDLLVPNSQQSSH